VHTHSPRVRLDHDTSFPGSGTFAALLALGLLTAAAPYPSAAQGAVPCTAIENDAERLACYDRALRGTPPAPAATRNTRPTTAPTPPAAAAAPAQAAQERPRERPVRESAAPAARTAPAAPAAAEENDEDAITALVIVGVRALPGRETSFTAEDGTVWVQTDSQRVFGLPDPPFDAELRSGAMGSHFLVPGGRGRAIRVREVR
jgi:hypothetical protein